MKIKTDSGVIEVNKKQPFAKFLQGFINSGAFSGAATLAAARINWHGLKRKHPSISAYDCGLIIGALFKNRASEPLMIDLCGEIENE